MPASLVVESFQLPTHFLDGRIDSQINFLGLAAGNERLGGDIDDRVDLELVCFLMNRDGDVDERAVKPFQF